MRGFLKELGYEQSTPTTIYVDNESSIALSTSMNNCSSNVSHMIMRINYIQQEILAGTVELKSVKSEHEVADILTKPLLSSQFETLRKQLLEGFARRPISSLKSKKPNTNRVSFNLDYNDNVSRKIRKIK